MGGRLAIAGNLIVFGIVALGAWLLWVNLNPATRPGGSGPLGDLATATQDTITDGRPLPRSDDALRGGPVVVAPSGLAVPVAGVRPNELVDTYTQSRAGGARVHNAIDIMAPRGRPVLSVAPGKVEKLFFSNGGGGITAYVRSLDGQWMYYYAHLDSYAPRLREGQRIERGTPIGTVGITGNANPAGPHLHFAINRMGPGEKWHQGNPINPYPLLAGNRASR